VILERIAVVGIGKIGLCLGLNLSRAGYDVLGIDKDREYVARINNKTLCTPEPGVEDALRTVRAFRAVDQIGALRDFEPGLVFIAVDTPSAAAGGYDHRQIDQVLTQLLALEPSLERVELALVCTTLPGYCDSVADLVKPHGYSLSYNPGFIAQGSIIRDQQSPDQVLIGEADSMAGDRLECVHRRMCINQPSIHRMSRLSAEIAKLATNCALTMKIAFANAIGDLATRVGAEPEKILDAVGSDARIGHEFLRYGFGYGGPCFPRDNRALNFFARQHACDLLQAGATDEMNRRHLAFQVCDYLATYREDEPIHFHSVTYKPGTEMLDESQPLALAVLLAEAGRKVVIHETPAVMDKLRRQFGELFEYRARSSGDGPRASVVCV
jgi:UDPglucose 6-dehydrogenase